MNNRTSNSDLQRGGIPPLKITPSAPVDSTDLLGVGHPLDVGRRAAEVRAQWWRELREKEQAVAKLRKEVPPNEEDQP